MTVLEEVANIEANAPTRFAQTLEALGLHAEFAQSCISARPNVARWLIRRLGVKKPDELAQQPGSRRPFRRGRPAWKPSVKSI
jgi:hypothetical protein